MVHRANMFRAAAHEGLSFLHTCRNSSLTSLRCALPICVVARSMGHHQLCTRCIASACSVVERVYVHVEHGPWRVGHKSLATADIGTRDQACRMTCMSGENIVNVPSSAHAMLLACQHALPLGSLQCHAGLDGLSLLLSRGQVMAAVNALSGTWHESNNWVQ